MCVAGMYNSSEVQLHWEVDVPVTLAPELHMAEFDLLNSWTNETLVQADWTDPRHGGFSELGLFSYNLVSRICYSTVPAVRG